jgi:hypothetical protein
MPFGVRFVASDVPTVPLESDDGSVLEQRLLDHFDPGRLGLPDLLGRLRDGAKDGDELTIDERQAEAIFIALGAKPEESGTFLPDRLVALRSACEVYLQAG